jgi:hypothetical protein
MIGILRGDPSDLVETGNQYDDFSLLLDIISEKSLNFILFSLIFWL